jgi:uncharacterized protein (TIGR00725 family)
MEGLIKISVIGGSQADKDIKELSFEVGREIAKNNALLVCGGMGGVMEYACRGAKSENGLTLGILPSDDDLYANDYVDIKLPTGLGYARNALVVLASHAVIAIDGRSGTLSEIGYALTYQKPLIGLRTWRLEPSVKDKDLPIIYTDDPVDAVKLAILEAKKQLKP